MICDDMNLNSFKDTQKHTCKKDLHVARVRDLTSMDFASLRIQSNAEYSSGRSLSFIVKDSNL